MGVVMYKVLIVDDEILTAQFLHGLISWEKFGCKVVEIALTVNTAYKIAREMRPDIIFMDIRMPEIDGIQLSQKIQEFHPDCRIIVLTAYQDFKTAKDAIQIGIKGFMIKHELDAELLETTLRATLDDLSKHRKMQSLAIKKWINDTVIDGLKIGFPESVHDRKEMLYFFLLVKTEDYDPLFPHSGNERQAAIFADKCNFPSGKNLFLMEISQLKENAYGFLYALPHQVSAKETRDRIMTHIKDLQGKIDAEISGKSSIVVTDMFSESHELVDIRLKPVLNEILLHHSGVLTEKEYFELSIVKPVFPENFLDMVLGYLQVRSPKAAELIMEPFLDMPDQGRCLLEDLSPIAALLERFEQMYANFKDPLIQQSQSYGKQALRTIHSLTMLIQWISGQADELIHMEENLYSKNRKIAVEAAKYIERNYSSDISTDSIAEYLHISYGYLRSLFKKEFHCTVSEYVVKVRLDAAKHLLLEKEKKIYEIATLCGFQTSQYFSATFKAIVGVSPKDFMYGARGDVK